MDDEFLGVQRTLRAGWSASVCEVMKLLLMIALSLWAGLLARAVTTLEQSFTCPIDGETWKQRIETSTRPSGLRLDLRKLGDVVDPPTLPQCPKCRFIAFSDALPEPVMKKLKAFVQGGDYQMIAAKSPSWACLAHLQEFLGAEPVHIGFSFLRASWQVEEKPALCERYLSRAYDRFSKVAQTLSPGHKDRLNVLLLCGELERRLGKFEAAAKRFRELLAADEFKDEPRREPISKLQMNFIEARDRAAHTLGPVKEGPGIPLGITPVPPTIDESKTVTPPVRSDPLDISKPFPVETGAPGALAPRAK